MKKHELKSGEDRCMHCGGTSSTPIECVERKSDVVACGCSHCDNDPQLSQLHQLLQGGHA